METQALPLFDWAVVSLPPSSIAAQTEVPAQIHARALGRPIAVGDRWEPLDDLRQLELDLAGGVTPLVPRTRYRLLTYRLTEFLVRSCGIGFLSSGFALEKRGVAFLGDLVQLQDYAARRWIRSARMFDAVRHELARHGLGFGMVAPRWHRPVDGFTHRHWAHVWWDVGQRPA